MPEDNGGVIRRHAVKTKSDRRADVSPSDSTYASRMKPDRRADMSPRDSIFQTFSVRDPENRPKFPTSRQRAEMNSQLMPSRPKNIYGRDTAASEEEIYALQSHCNRLNGSFRPDWACMSCGFRNNTRRRVCAKCELARPEPQEWLCQECKSLNNASQTACAKCHQGSSAKKGQYDTDPAHHWQHLRRAQPFVQQPSVPTNPRQLSPEDQEMFAQARAAEEQRSKRREQTKDGRFVGFTNPRQTSGSVDSGSQSAFMRRPPARFSQAASSEPLDVIPPATDALVVELDPDLSFDPSFIDDGVSERGSKARQKGYGVSRASQKTTWERVGISSAPYARGIDSRQRKRKGSFVRGSEEMYEDDQDKIARKQERKEQKKKAREVQKQAAPPTPIYLPEFISVSNLAGVLRIRVEDFLKKMTELGFDDLNNDHILDAETAGLIAVEFNFEPIVDRQEEQDLKPSPPAEDKTLLPPRPPIVTIMGHVDHGKTTLLDYLRKSSVAASEHGGITQHIGAFSVRMPGGRLVTFLDTPGHAAFLAMRQRGANVTDIVILVVAADDSVKPQTIEAIKHAQGAKVPIIVAINKVDKEDSNIERVKQDLARYGVEIEDFGGDTQVVCVSGKTGQGMEELEDAAVALADIIDMRAETDGQAEGWVLEGTTKKAGRVATVLVRRGTLFPGDVIVAGISWARVRTLHNEAGVMVPHAGPGTPVEVDGWREQPVAGDEMLQAPDEQKAKSVIEHRLEVSQRTQMATDMAAVNQFRRIEQEKREQLEKAAALAAAQAEGSTDADATETSDIDKASTTPTAPSFQETFFVLKADVSGSLEAVINAVSALGNDLVRPHILRSGVGPITEFDIDHAAVAKGHIISFNTVIDGGMKRAAETKGVRIIDQSIIYRLVDEVRSVLAEKMPDIVTQKVIGEAEVAQVFEINVKGRVTVPVAGCKVRNGVVNKGAKIRVLRDKEIVYDGELHFSLSMGLVGLVVRTLLI